MPSPGLQPQLACNRWTKQTSQAQDLPGITSSIRAEGNVLPNMLGGSAQLSILAPLLLFSAVQGMVEHQQPVAL